MASEDIFDALIQDMCTMATRKAFEEIEAEDLAAVNGRLKPAGPTPVQLSVWGRWKPNFPLPCPPPANRTEMMTPRWGKFLPAPKTFCDVETMYERTVSLTKRWLQCEPEMEDQVLRRKHAERVNVWRNLLITNKNETFLSGVFKYKTTKSLLDTICPTKKTRLGNSFEVVDLKDIIPEIVVDFGEDEVEVPSVVVCVDNPVKPQGSNKKKQRRRRFLSCFGK
ncbi:uncharacterized protein LOC110461769 [Mizuhopecten yessoensis]|uniref:Uncharacterized protein n=1 Tax=Mizuhopecten yessoensis TaxID=6573 RepID=A0A210PZM9_MIZYE|nr:uncharacterized protein LOC110461769 [Mizuhopecten yessoensis]OWF41936.1 hypothetical protein KP79_PYT22483 [Mizuhopecten yessoensis]